MKLQVADKNITAMPVDKDQELEALLQSHQTRIRVVGCGGGGNNTVTRLMEVGVQGVETLAINTDAQDLLSAKAHDKILIGRVLTKGLGGGSNPQIGEESARESKKEIEEALQGSDMVFVTCGLGGGTGTGSAPIVAETARRLGALTIAVVTLPFWEEGVMRWENARLGLEKLRTNADTIIIIQNDKLYDLVPDLPIGQAFKVADEILVNAVRGIIELVTLKGMVNLDFADIRTIMQNGGPAMIGLGESDGPERAQRAIEMALQNPLLDVDIAGARNALINITGGAEMTLKDTRTIMKIVAEKLDPSAKIIWGARIDPEMGNTIRALVIVTNFQEGRNVHFGADRRLRLVKEASGTATAQPRPAAETPASVETPAPAALPPVNSATPVVETPASESSRPAKKHAARAQKTPPPRPAARPVAAAAPVTPPPVATAPTPVEITPPSPASPAALVPEPEKAAPAAPSAASPEATREAKSQWEFVPPSRPIEPAQPAAAPTPTSASARRPLAPPSKLKAFKEKNHVHLQALQEAVVFLRANANDEETWQSIRMAMSSINETAQALDFPAIAAYAGTLEEIAERVLRGLFKVTPEVVAVFTRVAPVLAGMMHDDPPALQEARQQQERLQRLADEYRQSRTSQNNAPLPGGPVAPPPVRPSPQNQANAQPKPANSAPAPQLPGRRVQADEEVMAYLKGRFAVHKKN
ncbi:MAG: cell division protein FtsZ [candidate division KSB1 bacterium]|nr:cell division protein FtsZ [candidate division KSB1 bacterium]MDZ7275035.1 cell division protein FtsZ [candidate division KSB1 bacterium]MDZ7286516.1 cell division protein FtsZ [candidate division KSB1 bacterium]MDZ7299320.1 cell division protein FtsZ [candidate division KSB1 bacterium]MDZ7306991.1 cell division protein FtsZ [candidate division KSB1 bacterium]